MSVSSALSPSSPIPLAVGIGLQRHIAGHLVSPSVRVGVCGPADLAQDFPVLRELEGLSPSANPKRRADFAVGRVAAHRALRDLGRCARSVPGGRRCGPVWPRGVVGSITHSEGWGVAIVGASCRFGALGVDMEPLSRHVDSSTEDWILTADERRWIAESAEEFWPLVIFSAKEATYKAFSSVADFGFHDISFRYAARGVLNGTLSTDAGSLRPVVAHFALIDSFTVTSVEVLRPALPRRP